MMFDRATVLSGAALDPAIGPPATIGERAAIDSQVFAETAMSMSGNIAIERSYQRTIEDVENLTGRRLINPMIRLRIGGSLTLGAAEKRFTDELAALRAQNPDVPLTTPGGVREEIAAERAALRAEQADITRRSVDFPVSTAGVLATMGTAVLDPPILLSMALGAPAATGILRGALIESGIAAGVEVPVQTFVQLGRRQFGEEASLGEGLTAVAAAGAGGFLFSALVRSVGPALSGGRALLDRVRNIPNKSSEVKTAEAFLNRVVEAEDATPFPDTPRGKAEHAERLSEAEVAVREGRVADLGETATPVRRDLKGGRLPRARDAAPDTAAPSAAAARDTAGDIGAAGRKAALDRLTLEDAARGAIEAVAPLADDAEALAGLQRQLRARPAPVESLLGFLSRNGIRDQSGELRQLGITSRTRPGLLRREGQPLDEATLDAFEAGFFPGHTERPTSNDLLDAIREELHGNRIVREDDLDRLAEREALELLDQGLVEAGIDVRRIKPADLGQRIREVQATIRERQAGQEAARMARAGADSADVEERLALMAEEDTIAEADLRQRFAGREKQEIVLENDDGTVARMSVEDLFAGFAREADDLAALRVCAGGAA